MFPAFQARKQICSAASGSGRSGNGQRIIGSSAKARARTLDNASSWPGVARRTAGPGLVSVTAQT
jgi:hypothetical protein